MARPWLLLAWLLAASLTTAGEHDLTEDQKAELGQYFGFGPMQIYKLKPGIIDLKLADLDGDGRTDIALWNAHQSRFELFYQPEPGSPPSADTAKLERNEIPSRGNLRRENVPVAYRVASMEVADLTGDGRPDLVFFGEPRELVILPGKKEGGFGPPSALRAPEGEPRGSAVAVGDFDHDGHKDVALLGKDILQLFHQKPDGGLAKPVRIVHGIKQPTLMLAADINGDGRDDLAMGSDEDEYAVYVCLQDDDGTMSALQRVKVPNLRSMTFAKAKGGDDLFAVEAATGHLKHYRWQVRPQTGRTPDWPQRVYSYPLKIRSKRIPLVVGDLTGDGLPDCITADPDAAQLIVFRGTSDGFAAGTAFPGLMKTTDLCLADVDGDGHDELLSVSAEEKTLGVSHYRDGRVTFPKPMPVRGEPLAATVGRLAEKDPAVCLVYLARQRPTTAEAKSEEEEEPEDGGKLALRVVDLATQREVQSFECAAADEPTGLRLVDVNQDGRNDCLLFARFSPLQVFLQAESGSFRAFTGPETREGLVRDARLESFSLADVTGDGKPELLVAQKGLARALVVQEGRWTVVDQYNLETADAEVSGLATLPGAPGSPTIAMYDRKARDLLVLKRRADNTYAVAQSMPVGSFDLSAMTGLPIGRNGRHGLLLVDAEKLVLFTPDEVAPTLVAQHSYETDAKDAWLGDAVVGDLNHDGIRDVVAVDMRKAALEILATLPKGEFVRAVRFQVFQGKRFSADPTAHGEPRQVLVGDVTGDQIDDLVLIVHDRLIVYPGQ